MKDVSSPRGGQSRTKDSATGKASERKLRAVTDRTRLRRLKAAEIRQVELR
jgi:hypothetical protein